MHLCTFMIKIYISLFCYQELERHIEHLTKNHRHELGIEMASHRETKKQLQEYKEENENLKNKIKVCVCVIK